MNIQSKLLEYTVDYSAHILAIRGAVGPSQRVVFVSGNFNVVHPGHLRLLKFASELGNVLVVGINPDDTPGVTVQVHFRLEGVQSIAMVNHVLLLHGPPADFIAELKPDVVVKGKEFEDEYNPEEPVVESYGGRLVFSAGEMRFSSTVLLRRDMETDVSSIRKPLDFPQRYSFKIPMLKSALQKFPGLRALVVGDLIIDDYVACDPVGMSQEDPTIVVTPIETKTFVGGAGGVAAHARGLGADVQFCTVVGADEAARFAETGLSAQGVDVAMFVDESRPTTRKQRFRALNKTLLRVNHVRKHPISPDLSQKILTVVEQRLATTDIILFSDFNYGCLPQPLVDAIIERASERGVMMVADSQASSQMADISRFKGMTLVTPTEHEARLALHDFESGLAVVGDRLKAVSRALHVVITLGSEGLLIHGMRDGEYRTDRLPAFNRSPKDVAGAGDSLFACVSLALCAGIDIWKSTYLGALAAAAQVSRVGNAPLSVDDLMAEIDPPSDSTSYY